MTLVELYAAFQEADKRYDLVEKMIAQSKHTEEDKCYEHNLNSGKYRRDYARLINPEEL